MNEKDFYNSTLRLTKKTGQGFPQQFEFKVGKNTIENLIKKGLIKRVSGKYGDWICLTGGYCVEEEKNDMLALGYVRYYLGIKPSDKLCIGMQNHIKENIEGYNKWLAKNKAKLEETQNLPELTDKHFPKIPLTENEKIFISKRKWYKNNVPLDDAIISMKKEIDTDEQIVKLQKRMIEINNDLDRQEEAKKEIRIKTKNINRRNKFISMIRDSKNKKIGSKDFFDKQ